MWIGPVPHQLQHLTLPEQLLIARHYPRAIHCQVFPTDGGDRLTADQLQRGIRGNVTLYKLNTPAVTDMVAGQLMPQAASSLASVLAVTFIGSRKDLPADWLHKTMHVRRKVFGEALLCLKQVSPVYADIDISEERLWDLPDDNVPPEVLVALRHEPNGDLAEQERASYVPAGGDEPAPDPDHGNDDPAQADSEMDDSAPHGDERAAYLTGNEGEH
ncbi:hypothetical protein PLICRDRAFT_175680 [Plicaturopsis crispa FD-325 SS-3]|nr:hypothetical protein PLICRDRAFT_175680 [Plicaturopsis crispa FD-325 SS-3]